MQERSILRESAQEHDVELGDPSERCTTALELSRSSAARYQRGLRLRARTPVSQSRVGRYRAWRSCTLPQPQPQPPGQRQRSGRPVVRGRFGYVASAATFGLGESRQPSQRVLSPAPVVPVQHGGLVLPAAEGHQDAGAGAVEVDGNPGEPVP